MTIAAEATSGFQPERTLFRANDIRGIASGEQPSLTPEFALHLGKAFGYLLAKTNQNQVLLCRDARHSSPALHSELVRGLVSTGTEILDLGVGPTPLLCHAVAMKPEPYGKTGSGIMITASHNPPDHNGFKILFDNKPLYGARLAALCDLMITGDYLEGNGAHRFVDHVPTYLADFRARVDNLALPGNKLKVVVDAANGAAGPLVVASLNCVGVDVVPLYCEMDGDFPNHSPDTSDPKNLADLVARVLDTGAFCGIALDGDGDRMVAVSESGQIFNADDLMLLFSRDVLESDPDSTIVFDVKSSNQLINFIREQGGKPWMTKSGRSYIQSAMYEQNALLAGEFSSHFFFADKWYGSDDGIYAAARLLEICRRMGEPLSKACARPDRLEATDEISIAVDDERKFGLIRDFVTSAQFEGANLVTIDGLRIEYPAGWALVRASNTTAAITLRFEAESQAELRRLVSLVREELTKVEPALDLRKLDVA